MPNLHHHTSRARDKDCKNGYVREEELVAQMVKLIDEIDLNKISMREKFEAEVERMRKFQRAFAAGDALTPQKEMELRDYAKYLLKEGSTTEKRELLLCIKSRLMLTRGAVTLGNESA